jgi:hypoxanthine phosphoribosyltransferase
MSIDKQTNESFYPDKFQYTFQHLEEDIGKIYRQIGKDNFIPDYIIGLNRGGLVPSVCLSHAMQVPHLTIDWSKTKQKPNQDICELVSKQDTNFLIVDEICDTGEVLETLFKDWETWCTFDNSFVDCGKIRVASLVNYQQNKVLYSNLSGSIMVNINE